MAASAILLLLFFTQELFGQEKRQYLILAKNNSVVNRYIQTATLNGVSFDRPWILHDEIVSGGSLVFEMGAEPNKKWGILSPPPSMTK